MTIQIAERYNPFTHTPGQLFPLIGSDKTLTIYPAAVFIHPSEKRIDLPLEGPIQAFTAFLNLEKRYILVTGHAKNGYFSYKIYNDHNEPLFVFDKGPIELSRIFTNLPLPQDAIELERISFGMTKKSDWDLVKKRFLLEELLPYAFLLGQQFFSSPHPFDKHDSFLGDLENAIEQKQIPDIKATLESILQTGFTGVLCPQAIDANYGGFHKSPLPKDENPTLLPVSFHRLIKRLFIEEAESHLKIAPLITSIFPFGRAKFLKTQSAEIHIEWTKWKMRRCIIDSKTKDKVLIEFPKALAEGRLSFNQVTKKIPFSKPFILELEPGTRYVFDRFQI